MTKGEIVDEIVIDANMEIVIDSNMDKFLYSQAWILKPPPCSNPTRFHWCHKIVEDVEDPADDAEDPREWSWSPGKRWRSPWSLTTLDEDPDDLEKVMEPTTDNWYG